MLAIYLFFGNLIIWGKSISLSQRYICILSKIDTSIYVTLIGVYQIIKNIYIIPLFTILKKKDFCEKIEKNISNCYRFFFSYTDFLGSLLLTRLLKIHPYKCSLPTLKMPISQNPLKSNAQSVIAAAYLSKCQMLLHLGHLYHILLDA